MLLARGGSALSVTAQLPSPRPHQHGPQLRRLIIAPAKISGRFDESADQVKRLLERDRQEVKQYGDIGGSLKAEFDEGTEEESPSTSASTSTSTNQTTNATAKGFSSSKPVASPFGSPARSPAGTSPFGDGPPKRAAAFMEPEGLRPDLPTPKADAEPWYKKITLTQIVIVLSFTLIIASMLATFFVVLKSGGVRFNED